MLKVTRYIPVAEETLGGTPIEISRGLKMEPPPRPRAPATQPPRNANPKTLVKVYPSNLKSLSTKLIDPYFFLSACSLATPLVAK